MTTLIWKDILRMSVPGSEDFGGELPGLQCGGSPRVSIHSVDLWQRLDVQAPER